MSHSSPQHFFSQLPSVSINRSSFDRSHDWKSTINSDYLIPFFLDETLPGDTFNLSHSIYLRLISALDVPMMDNLYIDTHYFFVPMRLVWDNSKRFFGEKRKPTDSTDYTIPTIDIDEKFEINSIYDYFGLPYGVTGYSVSALPFRAYNLIYNEWFRSEQLIDWVDFNTGDGPDDMSDYTLLKRGKRFDYFTSALPQPSEGSPVRLPIAGEAPVIGNGNALQLSAGLDGSTGSIYRDGSHSFSASATQQMGIGSYSSSITNAWNGSALGLPTSGDTGVIADLTASTMTTIMDLAEAFQVQNYNVITARTGNRYTEVLYGHFGVISPDSSLQRPEYLGGSHDRLNLSVVTQTAPGQDDKGVGKLSAVISGSSIADGFTKSFTEHGFIIGLLNIYADLTYQQGLNRLWSRRTKFDFYWPEFANLFDQTILNKEIYTQGTDEDDDVFGYAERYAEYKYYPNMITGELRSTYELTLDSWHLGEHYENLPVLGQEFIEVNVPMERMVSVTDQVQFVCDTLFTCECIRPMPLYNDPTKWFMRA